MQLSQDFEDFIKLLNEHQVDYMVVGGYALALHGKPRNTGDLDIWIRISETNAAKMVEVMKEFGFGSLKLKVEDFLKDNFINQIGYPPLRIDIIGEISGVKFHEAFDKRQMIFIENDLHISYIGLDDFLRNKVASGRKKDLLDAKEIEKLIKKENKNDQNFSPSR